MDSPLRPVVSLCLRLFLYDIYPPGKGAHKDGEIVGHALPLARFRIVKRPEIVNVAYEFGRWPRVTPGRETIFSEAEPGSD